MQDGRASSGVRELQMSLVDERAGHRDKANDDRSPNQKHGSPKSPRTSLRTSKIFSYIEEAAKLDGHAVMQSESVIMNPCPNEIGRIQRSPRGEGILLKMVDRGFDATGSFVEFAQHDLGIANALELSAAGEESNTVSWGWYDSDEAAAVRKVLSSGIFTCLRVLAIVSGLFASDVCVILEVASNWPADVFISYGFVIFCIEFVGLSVSEASYPLSFVFWLDMLSTFILMFDISFVLGHDASTHRRIDCDALARDSIDVPFWSGVKDELPHVFLYRLVKSLRLGARTTWLTSTIKFLRRSESSSSEEPHPVRLLRKQMCEVLNVRMAGIAIALNVVLTLFALCDYPYVDESMVTWTTVLGNDVLEYRQADRDDHGLRDAALRLNSELSRFSDFYSTSNYGPYKVCYGHRSGGGAFVCEDSVLEQIHFESRFRLPQRPSAVWEIASGRFTTFFDLSAPLREEAAMNCGLILSTFMILATINLIANWDTVEIALKPIEQIIMQVRSKSAEILKFTVKLEQMEALDHHHRELQHEPDHEPDLLMVDAWKTAEKATKEKAMEKTIEEFGHELELLEQAFSKLSAILAISSFVDHPHAHTADDEENEEDLIVQQWMQGVSSARAHQDPHDFLKRRRHSAKGTPRAGHGGRLHSLLTNAGESSGNSPELHSPKMHSPTRSPGPKFGMTKSGNWMSSDLVKIKGIDKAAHATMFSNDFDALNVPADRKVPVMVHLILQAQDRELVGSIAQEEKVIKFVTLCEKDYYPNPFHNFSHALDTVNMVIYLIKICEAKRFLTEVALFWVSIAAVAHDIGHQGLNNGFLVESAHEIALAYNDRSPLENMHCMKLFEILSQPEANVFEELTKDELREARKGMIEAILHTDITKHSEMTKEIGLLYQMQSEVFNSGDMEFIAEVLQTKGYMMSNLLLHLADVNNPMKPWPLCHKWAHLVLDEFFAQGDHEKKLDIPVQMLNDRDKVNRPNSQVGFIEFMMLPLVVSVTYILPPLIVLSNNLSKNMKQWSDTWIAEENPPAEARDKVRARVHKVVVQNDSLTKHVDQLLGAKAKSLFIKRNRAQTTSLAIRASAVERNSQGSAKRPSFTKRPR